MHNPFNSELCASTYEHSGKTMLVKFAAPQLAFKEYSDWLKQFFGYRPCGAVPCQAFSPVYRIKSSLPAFAQCFFFLQMMAWIYVVLAAGFGVQQELGCRILPRSSFFVFTVQLYMFSPSTLFIFSTPLVLFISLISPALYYAGGLSLFVFGSYSTCKILKKSVKLLKS